MSRARYVDTAEAARGTDGLAIVVDVLRAFTTAAYAFAAQADRIILVATIEEAFELTAAHPHWMRMGEEGGLPIVGFDLANSPVHASQASLQGRTIVQR